MYKMTNVSRFYFSHLNLGLCTSRKLVAVLNDDKNSKDEDVVGDKVNCGRVTL